MAKVRSDRYQQSVRENPDFFFSPGALLLYGAASFLYELFPDYGPEGTADEATMMSFFGANKTSDGTYVFNNAEKIPDNWHNRRSPYAGFAVLDQIVDMYLLYVSHLSSACCRSGTNVMVSLSLLAATSA